MNEEIVDPAMDIAYKLANELGNIPALPASLKNPKTAAQYMDGMDDVIAQVIGYYDVSEDEKKKIINNISDGSAIYINDISDLTERVNITLRLWSGCLAAAKTIALDTRNGNNTKEGREELFKCLIDERAKYDPIYSYGVSLAPVFKQTLRKQPISFDGVPENSVVRKYLKQ